MSLATIMKITMNTIPNKQLASLLVLENLAIELDAAANSALMDTALTKHAQDKLNKVSDLLIEDKTIGDKLFIVYEVQGLIHWLNGEYDEANSLIRNACIIKKDKDLFTETATAVASKLTDDKSKNDTLLVSKVVSITVLVVGVCIVGSFGVAFIYFLTTLG